MEIAGAVGQIYIQNSSSSYDRVAQVRDYSVNLSADSIKAGHRDNFPYSSNLPGLRSGELSFDVVFDFNMHRRLVQIADTNEVVRWRIDWNDGTGEVWELSGGLTDFEVESPYEDVRAASMTIEARGRVIYLNRADPGFTM